MKFWFNILLIVCFTSQVKSQSVGGITTGGVAFCTSSNSGFIGLSSQVGTILKWESSINNFATVNNTFLNPTATQTYTNLAVTTQFRAIVKNGAFPNDTSTISTVTIQIQAVAGTITGGGSFCQFAPAGTLQLNGNIGNVTTWQNSINNGTLWANILNTSTSLSYPNITTSTLYRVIVENVVGCPTATSLPISFTVALNTNAGDLNAIDTVCKGKNYDTLKVTNKLGDVLNWIKSTNNGVSWQTIANTTAMQTYSNITQSTKFAAIVKNGICPLDTTDKIEIFVANVNLANAGPNQTITRFESFLLNGIGNGLPEWTPALGLDNALTLQPTASPLNTTSYTLTLTDRYSCESSDSMKLTVIVPIPTALSPNGDGINDEFIIDKITDYPTNSLMIFNRWGNKVFAQAPYDNTWNGKTSNGKDLPDEIYYFVFDYGNGDKPSTGYILIKR
jgi:gliding motility-associated-like protein